VRDITAFVIGGVGVLTQMPFIKHGPIDPTAVAMYGPLVGVPFFLGRKTVGVTRRSGDKVTKISFGEDEE